MTSITRPSTPPQGDTAPNSPRQRDDPMVDDPMGDDDEGSYSVTDEHVLSERNLLNFLCIPLQMLATAMENMTSGSQEHELCKNLHEALKEIHGNLRIERDSSRLTNAPKPDMYQYWFQTYENLSVFQGNCRPTETNYLTRALEVIDKSIAAFFIPMCASFNQLYLCHKYERDQKAAAITIQKNVRAYWGRKIAMSMKLERMRAASTYYI